MSIVSRANAAQSPVPAGVPANPADRPPAPRGVGNRPSGLASATNRSENCFASLWNFVRPYLESLWNLLRRLFVDERPAPPAGRLQGVHLAQSQAAAPALPPQNFVSVMPLFNKSMEETFIEGYFHEHFGMLLPPYTVDVRIRIYNSDNAAGGGKKIVAGVDRQFPIQGGTFTLENLRPHPNATENMLQYAVQPIDPSKGIRLGILFCAQKLLENNTYGIQIVNQTFDLDPSRSLSSMTDAPDQEMGLSSQGVRDRIARELRIQSGAPLSSQPL